LAFFLTDDIILKSRETKSVYKLFGKRKMISIETYIKIRERFGHFASWAIWAEEGKTPKGNIDDLTILDPDKNRSLLQTLHGNSILLGLNISRRIERPLGNFHDPRPMATDFKIRYALKGTSYWGSYMTDIIKDFEEKASGRMMSFLQSNKDFEQDNIKKLREEIEVLGCANPVLVTFGKDADSIAKRNLGKEFQIVRIPHYANYVSREDYRVQVCCLLPALSLCKIAEQTTGSNPLPRVPPL
jgi:hypothetical protein